MDLYLIRHGETVDNIAGLYAGVRDSALTVHGVEQARRLGDYLVNNGVLISHIFSSPLTRAYNTAKSIQTAQQVSRKKSCDHESLDVVNIIQVTDLIEQDFGYYEGKPFHARSKAQKSGKEAHRELHKSRPDFVDVESKESMAKRADAFLDSHLLPIFGEQPANAKHVVVVVSHGILLVHLWRRLLRRLPRKSITSKEVISNGLEHLGGWSNTGYLHLCFFKDGEREDAIKDARVQATNAEEADNSATMPARSTPIVPKPALQGWLMDIAAIDSKVHLAGLKRQRGGIGRLAHDDGQMKLDSFFKRQKKA